MKKNKTEVVFILDRSGSMGGLEKDTIGGFNSLLAKQKTVKGECRWTTVLFDDKYEIIHDRLDLQAVRRLTPKQYYVRGSTALLDAVGKTINKIIAVQRNTAEEHRADKVVFIITTDGYENASHEFTYRKIKSLIAKQKKEYNWEFIFLGANIDAVAEGAKMGIARNRAQSYINDDAGIGLSFNSLSKGLCDYLSSAPESNFSDDWADKIQQDYQSRKNSSQ